MTKYVSRWIEVLQQNGLQTAMKALTNYNVSLVWFIPETLLHLLGKELLLREWSKFSKVSGDKTFHKNAILASSQNPSKECLSTFWALGYPWIVCTNIPLPCVIYPKKENLGVVSCFYDFWKF